MSHKKNEVGPVEELELEIEMKNIDAQLGQTQQLHKTQRDLKKAYEKIGRMYKTQRSLLDQIDSLRENENIAKCRAEIASIEQEKNLIKAELAALQKDNEAVTVEKEKLADNILLLKQSNERLQNEIDKIQIERVKRDDEFKQMTDRFKENTHRLETIRQIAIKYKNLYSELQTKHDELVAEQASKALDQKAAQFCHANVSIQTDESLSVSNELSSSIAQKQQENESLRAENEKLSKRLSESDANHTTAMITIRTLIDEKQIMISKQRATETQSEPCSESLIDKENAVEMVRLAHENNTLQTRSLQIHRQSVNESEASASKMNSQKSPLDASRTTNAMPIIGNSSQTFVHLIK